MTQFVFPKTLGSKALLAGLFFFLTYLIEMPFSFLGDSYHLAWELSKDPRVFSIPGTMWMEFGAVYLVKWLAIWFTSGDFSSYMQVFKTLSHFAGFLLIFFGLLFLEQIPDPQKRKISLLVFVSPILLLFFGYVEFYPVAYVPLILFFIIYFNPEIENSYQKLLILFLISSILHLYSLCFLPMLLERTLNKLKVELETRSYTLFYILSLLGLSLIILSDLFDFIPDLTGDFNFFSIYRLGAIGYFLVLSHFIALAVVIPNRKRSFIKFFPIFCGLAPVILLPNFLRDWDIVSPLSIVVNLVVVEEFYRRKFTLTRKSLVISALSLVTLSYLVVNLFFGVHYFTKLVQLIPEEIKTSKYRQFYLTDRKTLLKGYLEVGQNHQASRMLIDIAKSSQDPNDLYAVVYHLLKNKESFISLDQELSEMLNIYASRNLSEYPLPRLNTPVPVSTLYFFVATNLSLAQENDSTKATRLWKSYQSQIHYEDFDQEILAKLGYLFLQLQDRAKADTCFRIFFNRSLQDTLAFPEFKIARKLPRLKNYK